MPSNFVLNIEKLLEPISAEQPTGPSVHDTEDADRYNAVSRIRLRYYPNAKGWQQRYRNSCLRGAPRPAQEENASWQMVVDQATTCLTTQSKDLWIGAYLLAGLTYTHGFFGLNQGLTFLNELVLRFGPQLHPQLQPVGELRKTAVDLEDALQFAPLTDLANGARRRLDFIIAADIATFSLEQLAPYSEQSTPLQEQLQSDLENSPAESLRAIVVEMKACEAGLTALEQQIRAQFPSLRSPDEYPTYGNVRKEIEQCLAIVQRYLKAEAAPGANVPDFQSSPVATQASFTSGDISQSRQSALRQLEEIAAFFERIEPLSPLPYVIRRAVAWGNMSLPKVLAELLAEEERTKLKERAGIPLHIESPPA